MIRITVADGEKGVLAVTEFPVEARLEVLLTVMVALASGCRAIHVVTVQEEEEEMPYAI